jgi:hypothetical protein
MGELDLEGIKARAKAAAPGPWPEPELDGPEELYGWFHFIGDPLLVAVPDHSRSGDDLHGKATAEHIAGMDPSTTLALVAKVERAHPVVQALKVYAIRMLDGGDLAPAWMDVLDALAAYEGNLSTDQMAEQTAFAYEKGLTEDGP